MHNDRLSGPLLRRLRSAVVIVNTTISGLAGLTLTVFNVTVGCRLNLLCLKER
jgi:hypothetical protein